ncbi:hypothetical protein HF313_24465 [Massilia atriviolacea]|uniref:Uncharacterized protein n=1 Tax=Massilia atriviolacea TaxID=2495579 RepID=A0A430HJX6_9BURK|nr:hypothetical protein [Massilia atriviolacea]RSZ57836.1 hypothetical protein EJB06_16020 [Massilia atriviolacea]
MVSDFTPPRAARRYAAIALTLLAHALLVLAWQHARRLPPADQDDSRRIQWVTVAPQPTPPPTAAPAPPPRPAAARSHSTVATARPAPPPAAREALGEAAPPAVAVDAPAPSAADILRQARSSIGRIDRELRKAHPGQPITAPVGNGATRLAQGLQAAADAAPNRWYEAPKVTEIIDPGPYSRRRYRVVGADGTYCITVESNHAPDGLDLAKGIQHKKTNCEKSEQAATTQKW